VFNSVHIDHTVGANEFSIIADESEFDYITIKAEELKVGDWLASNYVNLKGKENPTEKDYFLVKYIDHKILPLK
jgi:hypothetical protein